MSWVAVAVAGAGIAGSYMSSQSSKKAANQASNAQTESAELGIEEQRRQFDAVQKLLSPYVNAGTGALTGQQDLLGLNGQPAQQSAINGIQGSAQFGALMSQGENAILQNASATGGLRGGNTQGALAQFRPALLNEMIDQRYKQLGDLSIMGQNAAAGVGTAGMRSGDAVTRLLEQQGSAQSGAAQAGGRANAEMISGISQAFGTFIGKKF